MNSTKMCSIMADCNLTDICLALLKIKDNNFLTETILLSPWGNSLFGLPQRAVRLQELVAGQQQLLTAHGRLQCEQLCSAESREAVGTARGRGECRATPTGGEPWQEFPVPCSILLREGLKIATRRVQNWDSCYWKHQLSHAHGRTCELTG